MHILLLYCSNQRPAEGALIRCRLCYVLQFFSTTCNLICSVWPVKVTAKLPVSVSNVNTLNRKPSFQGFYYEKFAEKCRKLINFQCAHEMRRRLKFLIRKS